MLYLASQHAIFLAAAAAGGIGFGWLGRGAGRGRRILLLLIVSSWLAGLLASSLRLVNGRPALLIETALLYAAAYACGVLVATLLRRAIRREAAPRPAPVLALPPPSPPAEPPPSAPVEHLPRAEPLIVAPSPPVVAEPALDHPGDRPPSLAAPRDGRADDLRRIRGIGRGYEERLHGIGVWHLDQIAAWTPGNALWVGSYLAASGRIERQDWVGQAQTLVSGAGVGPAPEEEAPSTASKEPRASGPDRLTLLSGVGPGLADRLNRSGIWHFDQIAALREAELAVLIERVGGQPSHAARWREEADILAHGGETAHSRAVKAGRVTPRDEPG